MRTLWLTSLLLVTACASAPSNAPSERRSQNALDLPTLADGDCALFGWTADDRRRFVFYADEDAAKFAPGETVIKLATSEAFPALDYTDPSDNPVSLKLGEGEPLVGGTRYPTARITSKTDEGWDRVMPVAIVRSCQSG